MLAHAQWMHACQAADAAEPRGSRAEVVSDQANQDTMSVDDDAPPLFTPEQQAWLESYLATQQLLPPLLPCHPSALVLHLPPQAMLWLLHPNLEWTSPVWMCLFNTFVHTE